MGALFRRPIPAQYEAYINAAGMLILLFFVGAAAGFRNVYHMAKTIYEKKSEKDRYEEKDK